jgi:putative heme iron utilization protein
MDVDGAHEQTTCITPSGMLTILLPPFNQVDSATIVGVDRLGMYAKVSTKWGDSKLRVPWVRPVKDRKDLKDIIVEMTNASAGARA